MVVRQRVSRTAVVWTTRTVMSKQNKYNQQRNNATSVPVSFTTFQSWAHRKTFSVHRSRPVSFLFFLREYIVTLCPITFHLPYKS